MARTVYYAAVSVDGRMAEPGGGVAFLEPFSSAELGYAEFFARVDAVVLGRATYEQSMSFGPWPYGGRHGLVVTSRPIQDLPDRVRAVGIADLPSALRDLRAAVPGDIWVVGGSRTARACLSAGLLDELELYVVPRILGDGIPLLAGPSALAALKLVEARAFPNGVVRIRYQVLRGGSSGP